MTWFITHMPCFQQLQVFVSILVKMAYWYILKQNSFIYCVAKGVFKRFHVTFGLITMLLIELGGRVH